MDTFATDMMAALKDRFILMVGHNDCIRGINNRPLIFNNINEIISFIFDSSTASTRSYKCICGNRCQNISKANLVDCFVYVRQIIINDTIYIIKSV